MGKFSIAWLGGDDLAEERNSTLHLDQCVASVEEAQDSECPRGKYVFLKKIDFGLNGLALADACKPAVLFVLSVCTTTTLFKGWLASAWPTHRQGQL